MAGEWRTPSDYELRFGLGETVRSVVTFGLVAIKGLQEVISKLRNM